MFAMPRFLPSSSPIWRRPLGLAAAALAFAACGGDDPSSGPDAAPPPGPRIERLATDVCGQLNRSVTASFMHEGVIYLGCTGGALGSAWFRYDTATGQSVAIDDIVGAAFCNVTKRDVTLTYTECANPSSTPDIYQRAIIPGGLGPAVRVIERAPTSPLFFAESDRTFYVMGYDSGRLALWHLVRSDFEPPSLQVAVRIDSSVSVRGIIGGPDGVYVLEDSAGDSTLRYYPELAFDQPIDVVQEVGYPDTWFDRYQGEPTWFSDHQGDLRHWTLLPGTAQPHASSGCPASGLGVRAGDLLAFNTSAFEGGPDCGDRLLTFDLVTGARRAAPLPTFEELPGLLTLVGADETYLYGLDTKDPFRADLVRIRTDPI